METEIKMSDLDGEILDFLGSEPKKASSIATYLKVDRTNVNSRLYAMLKEGRVNKVSVQRTLLGWVKIPEGDIVLVSEKEEYTGNEGETVLRGNDAVIGYKFCDLRTRGLVGDRTIRIVGRHPALESLKVEVL